MIETMEHELARLAINECTSKVEFGEILIFTDKQEQFFSLNTSKAMVRFVQVPNWPSKIGWSKFHWQVGPHVRTRQTLGIQWDSWVWDPSMWRDEYLNYDIVGAPWWYKDGKNVGNLGFEIRSKQILQYMYDYRDVYPIITDVDDDLVCRKYRLQLEDAGFVWAPEDLARDFAFECTRPAPDSRHFGFHAAFNFKHVLDHDKLLERARIMSRSPYLKKSGYMWKSFADANPDIIAELAA
jgi:hypothetical protein